MSGFLSNTSLKFHAFSKICSSCFFLKGSKILASLDSSSGMYSNLQSYLSYHLIKSCPTLVGLLLVRMTPASHKWWGGAVIYYECWGGGEVAWSLEHTSIRT